MPHPRSSVLVAAAVVIALVLVLPAGAARGQSPAAELGQGWLAEYTLTSRQLLQLAEATPPEKFSWRPGPGVRSISEVYVHMAIGNLSLLNRAGVTPQFDMASVPKDPEKTITSKADVVRWLRRSIEAIGAAYKTADHQKKVQLFGRDTTADNVFLRILLHSNEHMGQSIAYARTNGIVPPWSATER
jgi:uncharacterized damage-inducible protein DinB